MNNSSNDANNRLARVLISLPRNFECDMKRNNEIRAEPIEIERAIFILSSNVSENVSV